MDESKNEKMTSLAGASSEEIARAIADVLDSMKARDIKLLRVSDKTVMTDYFVICSGTSNTQIKPFRERLNTSSAKEAFRRFISKDMKRVHG